MATYLPNSNDYIAKTKAYTPDFKFLADTLGRRQDRYNTNYKHLNDLYGKVVHADLSHDANIHKRDEYANLLVPKIQQLTGTDFSLQQNADAARALFKPFFEDKTVVRDIVYTKRFNNETAKAEKYRKSSDAKERDKYWQDGVDRLNWYMEDFKNATLNETMDMRLPEYVEDPDLIERGIEYLMNYEGKGKKLEMTDIVMSKEGVWMTTMTNGSVITNRPTGVVDKETGVMGTYNPAANIIAKTILDDPIIARGYATAAYVKARKFYENEDNIAKYGSKENAERYILNQIINQSKSGIEGEVETETNQKTKLTETKNSWEKYLEKYPNAGTKAKKTYLETLGAITAIDKGIQKDNKTIKDISREYKDLAEMRNIAYQAYMNFSINKDILSAANEYAMTTMEVKDKKLNPLYEKKLDHEYRMLELQEKYDNEKKLADYKQTLTPQGLALDGPGMQSGAPDASTNVSSYQANNDLIGDNQFHMQDRMNKEVNLPMFTAIEQMHTKLATVWSGAGLEVDPTGIEVDVFVYDDGTGYMKDDNPMNKNGKWQKKKLTWAEAKHYLIDGPGRDQDVLTDLYREVLHKYHHQVALGDQGAFAPMLGTPQFNDLNTTISQIEDQIRNGKADLLDISEKQNKVYKTAVDMILADNPELKAWVDENGSPIGGTEENPVLLKLADYQTSINQKFKKKVSDLGIPKQLKSMNQIAKENGLEVPEMIDDINYLMEREKLYINYLRSTFPPEVIQKAGYNNFNEFVRQMYAPNLSSGAFVNKDGSVRNVDDVANFQKSGAYITYIDFIENKYNDKNNVLGERGGTNKEAVENSLWEDYFSMGQFVPYEDVGNVHMANADFRTQDQLGESKRNEDAKAVYTSIIDGVNKGMTGSRAGSGFPTFSVRNEFMLKNQTDDGSLAMTDDWSGNYVHGAAHPEVTTQLTMALNAVNKLDKSMLSVKFGTPATHGEKGILNDMDWGEGMEAFLKQIRMDLRQAPSATNMPNISVTYNENLNGKSGWVLQFDQDYIKKLRSSATVNDNLLDRVMDDDNSITIYVERGLINNPLDISNMTVSSARRIIRDNGIYSHVVPQGGNVKAWLGSDGQTIYTQMTEGTWIQDDDKEWVYKEIAGDVRALPPGEGKIDEMMRTQREHLQNLANQNRITHTKNIQ